MLLKWIALEDMRYAQEAPTAVRRRAETLLECMRPSYGELLSAEKLEKLIRKVRNKFGDASVHAVFDLELRSLIGSQLTGDLAVKVACSLAGGFAKAKRGEPIGILVADWSYEDALVRVREVRLLEEVSSLGSLLKLTLVVCNGIYAGQVAVAELAYSSWARWAKLLGLVNRRRKVLCRTPRQLVGVEMLGRVERISGDISLIGASCNKHFAVRNGKLASSRLRKYAICQFGANYDCDVCRVGVNQCMRSMQIEPTLYPLQRVEI